MKPLEGFEITTGALETTVSVAMSDQLCRDFGIRRDFRVPTFENGFQFAALVEIEPDGPRLLFWRPLCNWCCFFSYPVQLCPCIRWPAQSWIITRESSWHQAQDLAPSPSDRWPGRSY